MFVSWKIRRACFLITSFFMIRLFCLITNVITSLSTRIEGVIFYSSFYNKLVRFLQNYIITPNFCRNIYEC